MPPVLEFVGYEVETGCGVGALPAALAPFARNRIDVDVSSLSFRMSSRSLASRDGLLFGRNHRGFFRGGFG